MRYMPDAVLKNIPTSVHQYMGAMFENTVYWHAQMQNESVKNTLKQVAKVPDAMHHSAEAHFNPANTFAFALTAPIDNGASSENAEGYIGALTKSYSDAEVIKLLKDEFKDDFYLELQDHNDEDLNEREKQYKYNPYLKGI